MKRRNGAISLVMFVGLLLSQSISFAKVEAVLGTVPMDQNPNLGFPAPVTASSEIILSRDEYVISYNKDHRSPNWVAWKLDMSSFGGSGRTNSFSKDNDLENYLVQNNQGHAVDTSEFSGSCFDRGHQIPSADRTSTKSANEATFMMSNMIPQTPYLNRVIWEHLESYTRDLVHQGKKVYVIAGPIYDANYGSIGPNGDIPVPSKDFKVIIVLDANQTMADVNASTPKIAVVMPNVKEDGSPIDVTRGCGSFSAETSNPHDWEKYITTVQDVENQSGISFSFQ